VASAGGAVTARVVFSILSSLAKRVEDEAPGNAQPFCHAHAARSPACCPVPPPKPTCTSIAMGLPPSTVTVSALDTLLLDLEVGLAKSVF